MTDTTAVPMCSMPSCDDPRYADGLCLEHWQQFNGPADAAAPVAARLADATPTPAPTAPTGRLRLVPMSAVVRSYHDGSGVMAVYGAYASDALAQGAADKLAELGIPDKLEVVPFYEVTP